MNKQNYLDLLRYYLRDLSDGLVDDIIDDYEEQFKIGLAEGKTEQVIVEDLGPPELLAKNYLKIDLECKDEARIKRPNIETLISQESKKISDYLIWLMLIGLAIIFWR